MCLLRVSLNAAMVEALRPYLFCFHVERTVRPEGCRLTTEEVGTELAQN